jgi:cation diffusion facilitator family transporter
MFDHAHSHRHGHGHPHSHGLVDPSIARSRAGVRAVAISLLVLLLTAAAQALVFVATGSVALLADVIHNVGDALTAMPLAAAFVLRSARAEKAAGYFVVATIFFSACVAAFQAVDRLIHPQAIEHLLALGIAGAVGFLGNEGAAVIRLRAGRRLASPALVADGYHARTDGLVSLAVVASAIVVALGLQAADPVIGLLISLVILRITWQSWRTIRSAPRPSAQRA